MVSRCSVPGVLSGLVLLAGVGCARVETAAHASGPARAASASGADAEVVSRRARGVIKAIDKDGRFLNIKHEAIAGYMPAMTMPFEVERRSTIDGLKVGDAVTFVFHEVDERLLLDAIEKVPADGG